MNQIAEAAIQATGGGGGGEPTIPLSYVITIGGVLVSTISALAVYIHREAKRENRELRKRLSRYEQVAPRYIEERERPRAPQRSRVPAPYGSRRRGGNRT